MKQLVMLVVFLVGCGWTRVLAYKPLTINPQQGVTDADLYKASVRVFSDEGLSFRTQDRDSGVLASQWVTVQFGVEQAHHSWRVTIMDGEARIGIDCEVPTPATPFAAGGWTDCQDRRNPDWIAKAQTYSDRIATEARSIASKRATASQ